ncbi:MAG: ABC transporter ATP-binding protein [Alphaproteobacteria bacterium]|nr:ABC transporter ATP-binding protein [Alphaproteobacteria bacterium]
MSSPFIEVSQLSVRYGAVSAVDDVDFSLARGEHLTLLGPSGCGKTTTLRAIAGLETPNAGRIAIDGLAVCDITAGRNLPPEKRGLSMVFQSYAIWPHMTVFENVAFGFRVRGIGRDKARAAVGRALEMVDLSGFGDRPATRLSGGQQQRVALARAIALDSKVVLFDEPLSNLDAQLRLQMRGELRALRHRLGFTAIYVTHDQEEAFALSDRIVIMQGGRIEQEGPPRDIHRWPRTRFVAGFLGMKNQLDAAVAPLAGDDRFIEARIAPDTVLRARNFWRRGGGSATIAFRPADVTLLPEDAIEGIAGTIASSLFLGDTAEYRIRSGALEICALGRPSDDLAEGRAVRWHVPPDACLVLAE